MAIWGIILPIAMILFALAFLTIHKFSPLKETSEAITISKKKQLTIYSIIAVPFLIAIFPFTDILIEFSGFAFAVSMFISGLIAVVATECSYYLSKKHKWNKVLVFTSSLVAILFLELALVTGYVLMLPPGSVT